MTKLLLVAFTFFGFSAFANPQVYDLKMELFINGKHISSPRIITRGNETASISQKTDTEESFIDVIATEGEIDGNKGILMNFVVGLIGKDGKRKILSNPRILTRENEKAEIKVGNNRDADAMSISVIAKRKTF